VSQTDYTHQTFSTCESGSSLQRPSGQEHPNQRLHKVGTSHAGSHRSHTSSRRAAALPSYQGGMAGVVSAPCPRLHCSLVLVQSRWALPMSAGWLCPSASCSPEGLWAPGKGIPHAIPNRAAPHYPLRCPSATRSVPSSKPGRVVTFTAI